MAQQFLDMQPNARLKLEYALEGVDVRDDLALPCVLDWIAGVEDIPVEGEVRIVVIALQTPSSMTVDGLESVWGGDRNVVRSKAYKRPC